MPGMRMSVISTSVNQVVAQHVTSQQEVAILVQRIQRLVKTVANRLKLLFFLRRQVVQILVHGIARMILF